MASSLPVLAPPLLFARALAPPIPSQEGNKVRRRCARCRQRCRARSFTQSVNDSGGGGRGLLVLLLLHLLFLFLLRIHPRRVVALRVKVNSATLKSQGDAPTSNVRRPSDPRTESRRFQWFQWRSRVQRCNERKDGRAAKTFIYLSFTSFVQLFVGVFKVTRTGRVRKVHALSTFDTSESI